MEILGFLASIAIGISLGLIGGGGSILTVPILVYLFGVDPVLATGYSLFVVGLTSGIGTFSYFKKGQVNLKTALVFGLPSLAAVYISRAYVVPAIPNEILTIGHWVLLKGQFLMLAFALLMLAASTRMIKRDNNSPDKDDQLVGQLNYPLIVFSGFLEGSLTGLVGAGGGFLIIPVLVLLCKLPMKVAVGTSLLIISVKSLIGFTGNLGQYSMDWMLLLKVSAFAIVGIIIGTSLSKKIEGNKLKPAFGWFVLVMAIYILVRELLKF
jgi:uncharacterized membrane protein YfcA